MLLNAADDGPGDLNAKAPGKRGKALLMVALIVGAAAGVSIGMALRGGGPGLESPDRP